MINESGSWIYVSPTGQIHFGNDPPPPNGSTLFAAPGSPVDADLAARYKMTERLGKPTVRRDAAGKPLAEHKGRAYAADALLEDSPARKAVEAAAKAEDDATAAAAKAKANVKAAGTDDEADDEDEPEAGAKGKPAVQGKAVRPGDPAFGVEDKAVAGPGAPAARKAPAKPTPKGK